VKRKITIMAINQLKRNKTPIGINESKSSKEVKTIKTPIGI